MALALVAALGATTAHAAPAADVPARVKALNELLAEQWRESGGRTHQPSGPGRKHDVVETHG